MIVNKDENADYSFDNSSNIYTVGINNHKNTNDYNNTNAINKNKDENIVNKFSNIFANKIDKNARK